MTKILCTFVLLFLLPVSTYAVECYEVKNTFDSQAHETNSANIVRSGWGKNNLFGPAFPLAAWFKFTDNVRVAATHNGQIGPTQYTVEMESVTSAADCNPIHPARLDPSEQNNFIAHASVELLFCIGWDATHYLNWGGQLTYQGDYFEVKYQNKWFQWVPFYTGTGTSATFTTKEHLVRFKVRVNGLTVPPSAYKNFWTYENCMNGPP